MSWSLVEAQTLAKKAARGAGYSWGLAEEAGFALRWLSAHGLPGATALSALLEMVGGNLPPCPDPAAPGWNPDTGEAGPDPLCPIALGAALADGATGPVPGDRLGPVYCPLLLAPFAAHLPLGGGLVLEWAGAGIAFGTGSVTITGAPAALLAGNAVCSLRYGSLTAATPVTTASRIPAEAAPHIEMLARFAARTYAPATEASRLAGAGAGTSDND
jgi:hypothetical protein